MIEVLDNYLPESDFKIFESHVQNMFSWDFYKKCNPSAPSEHDFQFMHTYIDQYNLMYPNADYIPRLVMGPYMRAKKGRIVLLRARTNLYIKTKLFPKGMGVHKDIPDGGPLKFFTLILYMEDSNGKTHFKDSGRKVISKRNRAVIFSSHLDHQTIPHTNILFRYHININFAWD